jgi:hypothetical protein
MKNAIPILHASDRGIAPGGDLGALDLYLVKLHEEVMLSTLSTLDVLVQPKDFRGHSERLNSGKVF